MTTTTNKQAYVGCLYRAKAIFFRFFWMFLPKITEILRCLNNYKLLTGSSYFQNQELKADL